MIDRYEMIALDFAPYCSITKTTEDFIKRVSCFMVMDILTVVLSLYLYTPLMVNL